MWLCKSNNYKQWSGRRVLEISCGYILALMLSGCSEGDAECSSSNVWSLDASNWENGARLSLKLNPLSTSKSINAQKLVLDTGSSTLAFCDSTLKNDLNAVSTDYISCNVYGTSGNYEGYWGPFFQGDVQISHSNVTLPQVTFSVMQQEVKMPCVQGFQGILGIAFKQLDQASANNPEPQWKAGAVGSCPIPTADKVGPVIQYLGGKGGVEKMGIYWSGQIGDGEGKLYLDSNATNNEHYRGQDVVGNAKLGTFGWYDINVIKVEYGESIQSITGCSPRAGNCIMDTGTPILLIPEEVYNDAVNSQTGELVVTLEGAESGSQVSLRFDIDTLVKNQWVAPCDPSQCQIILGLPLWAFYYVVFDITQKSVAFVPTNFTKAAREIKAQTFGTQDLVVL